jgi:hypothetical protein
LSPDSELPGTALLELDDTTGITLLELEAPMFGTTLELVTTLPGNALLELETTLPGKAPLLELQISTSISKAPELDSIPKASLLEEVPAGAYAPPLGFIIEPSSPHAQKLKAADAAITGNFFNIIEHSIFS